MCSNQQIEEIFYGSILPWHYWGRSDRTGSVFRTLPESLPQLASRLRHWFLLELFSAIIINEHKAVNITTSSWTVLTCMYGLQYCISTKETIFFYFQSHFGPDMIFVIPLIYYQMEDRQQKRKGHDDIT